MATRLDERLLVAAGTRDGVYTFESDIDRRSWRSSGPQLAGMDVSHAILDPRDGRTIWASASGDGKTGVYRSRDRGKTWEPAGKPFDADLVWHVEPGLDDRPGTVYAGVDPATLYRSNDHGDTWNAVDGLTNHPSRAEWWPGGGGLCLHTIITNPQRRKDLIVAMSVGGLFYSADEGETWEPRNEGVTSMADAFGQELGRPAEHPGVHRCVHKAVRHPANGQLYQQNHDGVYRSDDYGQQWIDISAGLPDRFGFVIGITADGAVYVVPQHDWVEPVGVRMSGQLAVYRTRDEGKTWEGLTDGLPIVENMTLYREGMATDLCEQGGVYFGTSDGRLLYSRDGGEAWTHIADDLPPVRSVSCEHFSG